MIRTCRPSWYWPSLAETDYKDVRARCAFTGRSPSGWALRPGYGDENLTSGVATKRVDCSTQTRPCKRDIAPRLSLKTTWITWPSEKFLRIFTKNARFSNQL